MAVLVLLAVQPAQAATSLIWDADGTPPYGGAGTWDTTSPYWYNSSTPGYQPWVNANNDDAVFGTSGGTVSLGTGITVHNLTFDTTGYLIQSDTLTLAGTTPTITANANAAISSVIAGSAGLTKTGAGTLTLSGANTTTGGVTLGAGTLNINHAQALGTGTFIISGGKID
ncbi:MAG TPA: autotransporter-associated beta strand repeat-containing protein, partial [Phycisphaerae bacterium]|nr:autotransporter-associated beta strand repeat-containing protein [Phycisphaerae bacterium]